MAEVEGELCEDPELALDQDPARGGGEAGGGVPGLKGGRGGAEDLPPEVENLLVKAEADQRPQLDVHLEPRLVSADY